MARSPFAVACLSERATHRVLVTALRGRVPPPARDHVVFVSDWAALLEEVGSRPPAVVVFDDEARGFDVPAVRRLRRAVPRAGVVAWLRSSSTNPRLATELATLGIDGFQVARRRPDPVELGETLRRHLAGAGFPPPRILITWCRLFHAASLLENGRRSLLNVALALDLSSPDALRLGLRRHADLGPTEVRDRRLDSLVEAFLRRHREGWWGLHGT